MKTCTRCEQPKPETDFRTKKSGVLVSWCKHCQDHKRTFAVTPGGHKCNIEELQAFVLAAAVHQLITTYQRRKCRA
jgi:hypothetical protein